MKIRYWMKQSKQENIIYLALWVLLFAAPLLGLYLRTSNDEMLTFHWEDVFMVWRKFALFFILFLVHNFLLAPILVYRHKRLLYFSIVTAIVVAFSVWQFYNRPPRHAPGERGPEMEKNQPGRPPFGMDEHDFPGPPAHHAEKGRRNPVIVEPDIFSIVMLIMMLGANIGIKGYFRSRDDRQRISELEKQNLEHQLEYLRFQINPHFFMNTLNNIHALIDIDPEKAQETIVELSKMMRYILYEGERQGVPLTKEMEFIRTYIKLMRLRYSDKVVITLNLPESVPERSLPPLLLISFIENAFKHGISYRRQSFVEIGVLVDSNTLHFTCRNSKTDVSNQERGGVGLVNVRRRLDLLYPNDYELNIHDEADTYTVELAIPVR